MPFTKPDKTRGRAAGLFGLAVLGSGLWRFLSAEGGYNGLFFGIVMGALALVASALFHVRKETSANIIAWGCILVVGGWFSYEALIKKGVENAEARQLIIIAAAVLTATMLVFAPRTKAA